MFVIWLMNEILIDTNVFIYALDKTSIYNKQSEEILTNNNLTLFTTTKNISELFAITSKLNISRTITHNFYTEIKRNVGILFPSNESLMIFEKLIKKYKPEGNVVFDMEIVPIMLSYNISKLATFNVKDFKSIEEIVVFK